MANVKVHLKEIIKYVLLLGVVLQSLLGLVTATRWILSAPSLGSSVKSVLGVCVGILLSYLFLRMWCKGMPRRMYCWGCAGIVSVPIVLQACLDAGEELLWFAGVCFVLFLCLRGLEYVKSKGLRIIMVVLSLFLAGMVYWAGSDAPSFAARLTSRFGFPYLYEDAYSITPALRQKLDMDVLWSANSSAEGVYTVFYPHLLERYHSNTAADEVCMELTAYCFEKNTKGAVGNVLWDWAGYHFPMAVSELQLKGMGYDSVTGWNYGELLQRTGAWAGVYWDYGVMWYLVSMVLLPGMQKQIRFNRNRAFVVLFLEVSVLCLCLEGAGYFDYKNLPLTEFIRMGMLLEGFGALMIEKDE